MMPDSDFDPTTGLSQTITIDPTGTGISKDNPTIDGALYTPCTNNSYTICTKNGESAELKVTSGYTSYQWYKDGQAIVGATNASYTANQAGSYTIKVNNGACPAEGCCPTIIIDGCAPCTGTVCLPATVKRIK